MQIDRDSFNENFTIYDFPDWHCSTCQKGKLFFNKKNITIYETKESKMNRAEFDNRELDLVDKYFIGTITCNNPECKEIFIIAGNLYLEENIDDSSGKGYTELYYPKYIFPTINIFKIPEETPFDVQDSIIIAFKIFWIDKPSCANAIRTTVDTILTDKKIRKIEIINNKRKKLTLHKRIELFKSKNHEIANCLMAVKWIGNSGIHEKEITNDDLLDGFEILKHSIEKLYTTHEKEFAQKVKQINKRKKPLA